MSQEEERGAERPAAEESNPPRPESPGLEKPGMVRTAVLVAGSALFGGLAVALWHRRTLAKMRQDVVAAPPPAELPEEGSTLD